MNTNNYKFNQFIEFLKRHAKKLEVNAAYDGGYSYGASRIFEQIDFWYYGSGGEFPPEWEEYEKEFNKEIDPDYVKYLELKKKFE